MFSVVVGWLSEWSNEPALKMLSRRGFVGSNPSPFINKLLVAMTQSVGLLIQLSGSACWCV